MTPRRALAALAVAVSLASCAARREAGVERIEFWGLGREGEAVAEFLPEFERRNPGIRVTLQQIPFIAAHEKILTAYAGDATPDVAQIGNTWIPELAAVRGLADLTSFARASRDIDGHDDFPGIRATNVVESGLYGIPWYVDTRVLFYRSDLLAKAGYRRPPRTWGEWLDSMERIRRLRLARSALLMPTNEFEPLEVLAMSNGSHFLNARGTRGAFEEPAFADAFRWYVGVFHRGLAPVVANTQVTNLYQQFAQGDFAMHITGPWNVGEFRRRLPPSMAGRWATAPLPARDGRAPTGVSMAGGSSLVVFRASRHQAAARRLIEYLSAPEVQIEFFRKTGDLPARRSAWASPELAADPYFPAFRAQLERVQPLPPVPEWEEIANAMAERGELAVRRAATVEQALAGLDRRADELLGKRRWMLARDEKRSSRAEGAR